jgi:hypothetical protein
MPRLRARGLVTAGTCIPAAVVSKRETIEKHRYSGALHSALPPWRATPLANLVGDPFTTAVGAATVASGGGTPGPPVTTVVPQPPQQQSSVFNASHSSIRAVIISGLSDPAKVIASPNVTVTGGIVALGKAQYLRIHSLGMESGLAYSARLCTAHRSQDPARHSGHHRCTDRPPADHCGFPSPWLLKISRKKLDIVTFFSQKR